MASIAQKSLSAPTEQEKTAVGIASTGLRQKISSLIEFVVNGRYLGLPLADWVCSAFLGIVATAWIYRANPSQLMSPLTPFLLAFFFLATATTGRFISLFLRLSSVTDTNYPMVLVLGFLPIGLSFSILRVITGFSFAILSVILAVLLCVGVWRYRRQLEWLQPESKATAMSLMVTLLAAVAVTFRVAFFCFPALLQEGNEFIVKMGDNEFYHAGFVTFVDAPGPSWEFGSQHLAGRFAFFYHFASYSGAGWLRSLTGMTSLDALFGFMTPLGLLLAAFATYALASTWFSPRIGFWAIALFVGMPDPAILSGLTPIQQSMYASPLLVMSATPANGYGLASSLIAILFVTVGLQKNRYLLIGIGLAVAISTVLWKAQLAMNVCLALGILLLPQTIRLLRPQVLIPSFATLLFIYWLSQSFFDRSRTPTVLLDPTWGVHMADWHLSTLPKTSLITYLGPLARESSVAGFIARIGLNALASFGLLGIVWFGVSIYSIVKVRRMELPVAVTFCSVFVFLTLGALLAENRTGFRFEMQYSPYFLPLLLMELILLNAVANSRLFHRIRRKPVPLTLGLFATVPVFLFSVLLPQDRTLGMPFPGSIAQCATYIRSVSDPFDVVQDSAGDPSALLTGMSERRTFVGLLAFKKCIGMVDIVRMYEERLALNDRLLAANSIDELHHLLEQCPIRWYVLWPDAKPAWPKSLLDSPVFQSGEFRVYDLNQLDEHR